MQQTSPKPGVRDFTMAVRDFELFLK
jgi:hypothetical protein